MAAVERVRFKNTTEGFVGAITIDARGNRNAVAVEPGTTVELSEEEQLATANAPRRPEDSPFEETEGVEHDDDGNVIRRFTVEPALIAVSDSRPIPGSRRIPGTASTPGSFAEHEETGTPVAG